MLHRSRQLVVTLLVALAALLPAARSARAAAAYLLPWQPGQFYECIQGNNSLADHQGIEAFAFDFPMRPGTLILAARSGAVSMVKSDSNVGGFSIAYDNDANYVVINQGDGTQ